MKKKMVMAFVIIFILLMFIGNNKLIGDNKDNLFRISAGYGVPYGYTGVNFEVNPLLPENLRHLNNYFSFSLGLGYKQGKPLLAMGVNAYPLGRKGLIQPRFSFYYAKVDRILDIFNTYEEDYDSIEALCLGGGVVLQISDNLSINGDMFYLAHIYDELYLNTGNSRFKVAVGGQFHLQSPYAKQVKESSFLNWGVGLGIPYGVIGLNIELNPLLPGSLGKAIHDYFSVSIGAGFTNAGSAYSIGFRFYPLGKENKYRFRIGIYQGTVAVYNWSSNSVNLEGFALSTGALYKINDNLAFDCDFVYIAEIFGWSMSEAKASRYKISLGIRYMSGK